MPDKIIREIPLIARYARHNEAEDYRFRDYLKNRLNLSNAALDAVVGEVSAEVCSEIDCTSCGNCCRTLEVVVDTDDIARLSKRVGMPVRLFTQRYVRTAADRTRHFAASPCPFLGTDNRCSVYEDRPKACRDFPYLDAPNFRSRSLMTLDNCARCPIVFNVWQRLKTRLRVSKGGVVNREVKPK